MYCSSCGGNVLQGQGLTFCNHCGTKLSLAKREEIAHPREINPEALLWAIVGVFLGGLGIIIGLMAVMEKVLHLNVGLMAFFSLLSFVMMTVIETVFIWRFIRQLRPVNQTEPTPLTENSPRELSGANPKTLAEPLQSVTDHTTRSFDPLYTKRTSE